MRLVACAKCHAQYDVTKIQSAKIVCGCGADVENRSFTAIDAEIHRCGSCGATVEKDAVRCEYCRGNIVRDRTRLGLICPECYARNPGDSNFCTNCAVEFRPQVPLEDCDQLLCPVDGESKMVPRSIGGVVVQECMACNGLWVPGDEFNRLVDRAVAAQATLPSEGLGQRQKSVPARQVDPRVKYRKCPSCGDMMVRKNFGSRSGVIVDWCGQHGTWLDADELESIAKFVMDGGLKQPGNEARPRPDTPGDVMATYEFEKWTAGERKQRPWPTTKDETESVSSGLLEALVKFIGF